MPRPGLCLVLQVSGLVMHGATLASYFTLLVFRSIESGLLGAY
jgi:hypothetical protein